MKMLMGLIEYSMNYRKELSSRCAKIATVKPDSYDLSPGVVVEIGRG